MLVKQIFRKISDFNNENRTDKQMEELVNGPLGHYIGAFLNDIAIPRIKAQEREAILEMIDRYTQEWDKNGAHYDLELISWCIADGEHNRPEEWPGGDQHNPVVTKSFAQSFIDWFPFHTKLYLRGEKGKDWEEVDKLYKELASQLHQFFADVTPKAMKRYLSTPRIDEPPTSGDT